MPSVAHNHSRHHGARHIKQPLDVGVDHLLPVLDAPGIKLLHTSAETGIVDQDLDLRPLLGQLVDGPLHGQTCAHVERNRVHGLCSGRKRSRGHLRQLVRAPRRQQQPRPLVRKGHSRCRANAARRAGNQYNLALQTHIFLPFVRLQQSVRLCAIHPSELCLYSHLILPRCCAIRY